MKKTFSQLVHDESMTVSKEEIHLALRILGFRLVDLLEDE